MPICPNNVRIDLAGAGHSTASQAVNMCMVCLEHAHSSPTFFASTKPILKTGCATDNS